MPPESTTAPAPAPAREASLAATARDLVALTKPRITLMVLLTAAGGMWLAPGSLSLGSVLVFLGALAATVGSANALNCWLERDVDALMRRTASRPLPSQRLAPRPALAFSIVLGVVAVPLLAVAVNPLTGLLGAIALVSYVLVYTPMKQISPAALLVGAVPGAMPPLMGWTAMTGRVDLPGLVLFGMLFIWQLPHFIAIATFRKDEYARAGLKVLPWVRGDRVARVHAIAWAALLVPVSLALVPLGVAGWGYAVVTGVMGAAYLVQASRRPAEGGEARWAKRLFLTSLVYLPVVIAVLMIDAR
jgi:protoheme IX farnesyltransferase